jgi:hypothetical protein
MSIEDTKLTTEVGSTRELNKYLKVGWVLILSYVKHNSDTQNPKFVLAWQTDAEPIRPEFLDEWDIHELDRYKK